MLRYKQLSHFFLEDSQLWTKTLETVNQSRLLLLEVVGVGYHASPKKVTKTLAQGSHLLLISLSMLFHSGLERDLDLFGVICPLELSLHN